MKTRLIILLGLLLAVGLALVGPIGTANAKDFSWGAKSRAGHSSKDFSWGGRRAVFTDVTHAADDSGYTAAIKIRCRNDGSYRWLYRGESSFGGSKACGGLGVDAIWVGSDQAVRCSNALPPYGWHYFLKYGWNEVPSYASLKCYMQRPI